MTKQEKHLWYDFLCKYPVRFQRQKTIENYIADFFCHRARLIIELDGSQHYTESGIAHDKVRTNVLKSLKLEVLRFSNRDVDESFYSVCAAIDQKVKQRLQELEDKNGQTDS